MSDKLTEAQLKRMAEFGNDPGRAGSSSVATELLAARALLVETIGRLGDGSAEDDDLSARITEFLA